MSDTNALIVPDDDGFAAAAAEADQHMLRGQLIKFTDGQWTMNKSPIPKGALWVPVKLAMVWVRWENKRPVQYEWPRPSGLLPGRESLGYDDEGAWPLGLDGKPKDPWQNTRFIYLTNTKTAATHTFSNSTAGMRHCYTELGDAVRNMRQAHPRAIPVVELDSIPMPTKVGSKLRPHLRIVGWRGLERGLPAANVTPAITMKPAVEMDDVIPF